MNFLGVALKTLLQWITLRSWRSRRARERYDFLKAEICKRHFGGYKGLIVNFPGRRFKKADIACFRAPMYYSVKNRDNHWVIFWDHNRMTREIGTGAPLKDGETIAADTVGRTKPQGTLETIDEQTPLVLPVVNHEPKEGV